jgi:putative heme transporter
LSRRAWIIGTLTLVAGALAVRFGLNFPWAHTFDILIEANWLVLGAAALLNVVSLAAKSMSWYLLLRRLAPLRAGTAQAATFVGAAVNSISVSVSGEVARAQLAVTRDKVSFGAAVASLLVSRVVEALGLVLFLSLAFVVLPPWPGARVIGLALAGGVATTVLGYRLVPWSRLHARALGRWHDTVIRMAASKDRGGLGGALAFATCNWIAQWFTYHWSIAATHVAVTPAVSLMALVLANLVGILRLTPGNIGVLQGSLVVGMQGFEIPAANALAAGLALQAVQVLPVLAIGMVIVGRHGFRSLAARRSEVL